ncbi:unnamed protein product, partial [Adineta steineri]
LNDQSATFTKIIQEAEQNIRDILSIPDSYAVLFLQDGASNQFSAIPLNFINLKPSETANYLVTGYLSQLAAKEAEKFGTVNLVIPKQDKYTDVPDETTWKLTDNASYFYYCCSDPVYGIEFDYVPTIVPEDTPIICDMSYNFLTRTFDVTKFGAIFASAEYSFGPNSLTLVIVRKDLVQKSTNKSIPVQLDYKIQMDNRSMDYAPPAYGVYIANKMFNWTKRQGGLKEMDQLSEKKSSLVYEVIDKSNGFYVSTVNTKYRSRISIQFRIVTNGSPNEKIEQLFLDQALRLQIIGFKDDRPIGGIYIDLHNNMTLQEITELGDFMESFQGNDS